MSAPDPVERFRRATQSALRAVSGRDDLDLVFGGRAAGFVGSGRLRLPLPGGDCRAGSSGAHHSSSDGGPADAAPIDGRVLVRGQADRFALRLRWHDPGLYRRTLPRTALARLVFATLEAVRLEALGAHVFPGTVRNIGGVLEHEHRRRQTAGRITLRLPDALHRLAREALLGDPIPSWALTGVESWRGRIAALADADTWTLLARAAPSQTAFAGTVRRLLAAAGIDSGTGDGNDESGGNGEDALPASDRVDRHPADVPLDKRVTRFARAVAGVATATDPTPSPHGIGPAPAAEQAEPPHPLERTPPAEDGAGAHGGGAGGAGNEGGGSAAARGSGRPDGTAGRIAYRAYTREFDEVVPASALGGPGAAASSRTALQQALPDLRTHVTRLAARLQRRLMARRPRDWHAAVDEGVLDPARLAALVADPACPTWFKRAREGEVTATAVSLLIDNSGSMRGHPIAMAAVTSDILARVLERCGVSVEVLGFTTRTWRGGRVREVWLADGCPPQPGRLNELRHIVYKAGDRGWRRERASLGVMLRGDLLKENIDGEALLWAQRRLLARPEPRRILLVVSDGAPADAATTAAGQPGLLDRHLRAVVAAIEARGAVELLAVGIGHDVSRYYRRAVTLDTAETLAAAMVGMLASVFEAPPTRSRSARDSGGRLQR